ncbi:MAG TPA: cbb3-type cytochrome c oxidase subunit 3 [Acidisphaera sp.]|nr:cbb3-type cytochrome c oxidase subunit 3 [Acidisphaera sp.]
MLLDVIQWLQRNMIVLMMAIFVVITIIAYWPGHKRQLEEDGRIPLRDDS